MPIGSFFVITARDREVKRLEPLVNSSSDEDFYADVVQKEVTDSHFWRD